MSIILAKVGLSLAALLLVGVVLYMRAAITARLKNTGALTLLIGGWIVFRLLPFLAVYLVAGFEPTSDVIGFWNMASAAAAGKVVYLDFWSPYSPLYSYFLGAGAKLWYSPRMVVLIMTLMDGVALGLSWLFYRNSQPREVLLYKALLYLILPGSLILCVVGAQEDVWMWLFVVLAWLVRQRTRSVVAYSLVLALGLMMTKAIFVLIFVPLFLLETEKIKMLLTLSVAGLISLAVLYSLVGWEFTQPLGEADVLRAPNVLSVLNPWAMNSIGTGEKFWNWIGLLLSVGLGTLAGWRLRTAPFYLMLSHVWVIIYATMMIVQQSAYSNYIFLFLLPLVFYIINWKDKTQVGLLLLYNLLCVVHPSYWWRMDMPKYLSPADVFASSALVVDYLMQAGIVALTIYFIWLAFPKREAARV
ncbi:hypothetical protein [Telluribacter sp. SYSU D00476]|uniref:hypothetical protein n=1 Tax=Telluribacter sp. SYSU D00476 TaxID=2811430 RepID=UPI001FF6E977|nr:hypothetical protein [Telluribacter sp. SYSU D00476]